MSIVSSTAVPNTPPKRTFVVDATTNDGTRMRFEIISRTAHGAVTHAQRITSERYATFLQEIHSVTFFAGNK